MYRFDSFVSCLRGVRLISTVVRKTTILLILSPALAGCSSLAGDSPTQCAPQDNLALSGHAETESAWPAVTSPALFGGQSSPGRSATYVLGDLIESGDRYESTHDNKVTPDGSGARFFPNWAPGSQTADDLAYCMYRFMAEGFDRRPEVWCYWTSLSDTSTVWVGLANWPANRWDWYRSNEDCHVSFDSMDPYMRFGEVLVMVLVCDDSYPRLNWVHLGPNIVAKLSVTNNAGTAPLTANFNAGDSTGLMSPVNNYDWDWDSDGTYEFNSGEISKADHTFLEPGNYTVTVRASRGQFFDTASVSVEVSAP